MRLIGPIDHTSGITTTARQLTYLGLTRPAVLANAVNLWEHSSSTVTSLLRRRGMFNGKLSAGTNTDSYRVVGNRKVQWRVKGMPNRKGKILSGPVGAQPGLNGAHFEIVVDTDWFNENNVLELADRRTHIFVHTKEVAPGGTRYTCSLLHNKTGAFVDPTLLVVNKEIGFAYTAYPELSEDGDEKNTYDEWETAYMGIQRMKYTISGTARNTQMYAIEHNGQMLWETKANLDMMARWAAAQEYSNLFGVATVDANERVFLKDKQGRDIYRGDGLFNQGDPGLKFSYNTLSFRVLDNLMSQMDIMSGADNSLELMLIAGSEFTSAFERLMVDVLRQNPQPLVEGSGNGKGINTGFYYYVHNGVRINVAKSKLFDRVDRPIERDSFGRSIYSQSAYFVPMGNLRSGDANVELISLGNGTEDRSLVLRAINGMTGKGPVVSGSTQRLELASSPVDGIQVHALSESGIILRKRNSVGELRKTRAGAI